VTRYSADTESVNRQLTYTVDRLGASKAAGLVNDTVIMLYDGLGETTSTWFSSTAVSIIRCSTSQKANVVFDIAKYRMMRITEVMHLPRSSPTCALAFRIGLE